MSKSEKLEFQTEVSQLLKLMINSVYSEKEVFVRELVSNASDACDKLRYLANTKEKLIKDDPNFKIQIAIDKKSNLISISDNGVGMNKKDLVSNLGTIARSGTAHFLKELSESKTKDLSLIGQFGVDSIQLSWLLPKLKLLHEKLEKIRYGYGLLMGKAVLQLRRLKTQVFLLQIEEQQLN